MTALHVTLRVTPRAGSAFELDVRFDVPPGVTVLFGASGAGKSTTLAAITGLIPPAAGRIALDDDVLYDSNARIAVPVHRRRIALVFQSLALFPHLNAEQNVMYGMQRRSRDSMPHAIAWLERTRVPHLVGRRPHTYSGGEAQRVALARALAAEPRALLLDEPFSAMDEDLRGQLRNELKNLVTELALPTLFVTHDRTDALALGDHAVRLSRGRVVNRGTPAEVLAGADTAPPAGLY